MFIYLTKLIHKVKIASDKTESKQNNVYFTRKIMGTLHNKTRQQLDQKEQRMANKKIAYFFKK